MKKIIIILFSMVMTQELEVDGDLKVTGNLVFSDSSSLSSATFGFPIMQGLKDFTSNQEWTVPEGTTKILVEAWGGGGGGSGWFGCAYGGAGGNGGYILTLLDVIPGEVLNIQIGNGGGGGWGSGSCSGGQTPGGDGGSTKIINSSTVVLIEAYGGNGGELGGCNSGGSIGANGYGFSINGGIIREGSCGGSFQTHGLFNVASNSCGGVARNGCSTTGSANSGSNGYLIFYW